MNVFQLIQKFQVSDHLGTKSLRENYRGLGRKASLEPTLTNNFVFFLFITFHYFYLLLHQTTVCVSTCVCAYYVEIIEQSGRDMKFWKCAPSPLCNLSSESIVHVLGCSQAIFSDFLFSSFSVFWCWEWNPGPEAWQAQTLSYYSWFYLQVGSSMWEYGMGSSVYGQSSPFLDSGSDCRQVTDFHGSFICSMKIKIIHCPCGCYTD